MRERESLVGSGREPFDSLRLVGFAQIVAHVQQADVVLGLHIVLQSGGEEVLLRILILTPLEQYPAHAQAGVGIPLVCGQTEELLGFLVVHRNAFSGIKHERQVVLGIRFAHLGGLPVELGGLRLVLKYAVAVAVHRCQNAYGIGVPELGGLGVPFGALLLVG